MVPNKEADGHSRWAHLQRVLYDIILLGLTRNNPNTVANSKPSLEGAGVMGSQSRRRCIGKDGLEYIHWIFASRSLVGAKYMHM